MVAVGAMAASQPVANVALPLIVHIAFFFTHLNGYLGKPGNTGSSGKSGKSGKSGNTGSSLGNTGSPEGLALCLAGTGIPGNTGIHPWTG